jgi:hypothetical protein
MRTLVFALSGLAAAASGCGKSKSECRAEATALHDLLVGMDKEPSLFYLTDRDPSLVVRGDLPKVEIPYGPSIHVGKTETRYEGQLVDDGAMLGERLEASRRAFSGRSRDDVTAIHLLIDDSVPWQRVVSIVEATQQAGFVSPHLVFRRPPPDVSPPPRSAIDDELDKLQASDDASNKATKLAEMTQRLVKSCPALVELFGSTASEHVDKADHLARGIGPALIACDCNADIPALRSIFWRLLHNPSPVVALPLAIDPGGTPISLPSSTPWRDASRRFTATTRTVALTVAQ